MRPGTVVKKQREERDAVAEALHCIDQLAHPAGLSVLGRDGVLAFYNERRELERDAVLTERLGEHIRGFLESVRARTDERLRLAVVFTAAEPHPWGPVTFYLEEPVLRELYPVGGPLTQELTAFQRKNREKSVFRGLELLLARRNPLAPAAPVFCPVLFDPERALGDYRAMFERALTPTEATQPAVEVLNLVGNVPLARRDAEMFRLLHQRLQARLVRTELRADTGLELLRGDLKWHLEADASEAYADLDRDRRLERELTFTAYDLAGLHQTERVDLIEFWLAKPIEYVEVHTLRRFVQLRDAPEPVLRVLSGANPVYSAPSGARLLERGMRDAWNLYLLEGTVAAVPEDGATVVIEGDTDKAAYPVAFLKPRKYTVTAITPVRFLWVHDRLLAAALGSVSAAAR